MPVNGLVTMTPTSIASTGTGNSSSINTNGSVTFSSCETLSLNGVFTSNYDNYMISLRASASTDSNVAINLRSAGTDNKTASSYVRQRLVADSTLVSGSRPTATTVWTFSAFYAAQRNGLTAYIFGPALSQATAFRSVSISSNLSATLEDLAGTHNQTTSYDGFTLSSSGSGVTLSGLITVYGFNQ